MKCDSVRNEIKAYIDGELGLLARWRVARHLAHCAECREEEKAMTDLTAKLHGTESAQAPSGLRSRIMGGIEFKPREVRLPGWRVTLPQAAAVAVTAFVVAAIVFPVLHSARKEAAQNNMRPLGLEGGKYYTDKPTASATPAEPKWRSQHKAIEKAPSASSDFQAGTSLQEPMSSGTKSASPAWFGTQLKIIKTADMSIEVKSFQSANDDAVMIAQSAGGYVTDSASETEGTTPTSGGLTVRVPSPAFERTVVKLSKLGTVKSKAISGQDVTGEVVDLESRLRNKQAEERQYLEIMNRAKRVPDIVTVTEELSRVRGEIEETQGRLKYLRSSAEMSTINLTLAEKKAKPAVKSSIERTFGDALGSLARTGSAMAGLAIWLAVYSPFWALPIILAMYFRKKARQPA